MNCDCSFCCLACGPHEPGCIRNEINENEDDQ